LHPPQLYNVILCCPLHKQGQPVWQQILARCQESGWCDVFLPRMLELRAQLAAKQEQLQHQQEQLQHQQEQLDAKDQLLAEQAAELAVLRAYIPGLPQP
jgi:phage-related minor tail protein